MDLYEWADDSINSSPRYATGFTQLLSTNPYQVSTAVRNEYVSRLPLIRSFQKTALAIFKSALNGEMDPRVLHWLTNEAPTGLGIGYHRGLEDRHFTLPVFFRTDEARPGRINEIQCPGSAWGDLQLTYEYTAKIGHNPGAVSPANQFAAQLTDFLKDTPVVHHLLDQSSAPPGMRFFIEKTRPHVKYWSIDPGVRVNDCNFVRSHSFYSLCSEYEFTSRMARVGNGVTYDLPPHILFDQKATLILPFWSMTRALFTDDIREILLFSTPLLPDGIELQDGTHVTIDEFSRLPKSRRSYYLKYAGADLSLNWGSKGVYRLSNLGSDACGDFLHQCLIGFERGRIWLLQKEEFQEDEISYITRDDKIHTQNLRGKFSGFYGPYGCLGVLAMHRHHFKVHGQEDTVVSYVLADGDGSIQK